MTCRLLSLFFFALLVSAQQVSHDNKKNFVIDNQAFSSATTDCLKITNSQMVTIKNSRFIGCFGVGIVIEGCNDVVITNTTFEDVNGGVYALDSSNVMIRGNSFKNVARKGKLSFSRGQFVQFDKVTGGEVSNNYGFNDPAVADPEDLVSMYKSSGTAQNYMQVFGNCFQGGGASLSGGGIMTGDAGGSFIHVHDNILIDPGQYGLAVASGNDIIIENNRVLGRKSTVSNVGLYVWNQYSPSCIRITARNNVVDWINKDGARNPFWDGENCGTIAGWSTNLSVNNLTLSCSTAPTTTRRTTTTTLAPVRTPSTTSTSMTTTTTQPPSPPPTSANVVSSTSTASELTSTTPQTMTTTTTTTTTTTGAALGCYGCACRASTPGNGGGECDANLECKRTSDYSVCTYIRLYTTVAGDDESCSQMPKLGCRCDGDAFCQRASFVCSPLLKVCDLPPCDKGMIGCACGGASGDSCFDNGICASGTCYPDNRPPSLTTVASSSSTSIIPTCRTAAAWMFAVALMLVV